MEVGNIDEGNQGVELLASFVSLVAAAGEADTDAVGDMADTL